MQNQRARVGVVVPSLPTGGGVSAVARYLYEVLDEASEYKPEYVSLAVRRDDPASVRLTSPGSWLRGVRTIDGTDEGNPYQHVGAYLSDFEFQRYMPRRLLTERLNTFDLVQVVAGYPAWALVAKHVGVPVALQVATLARAERSMKATEGGGLVGSWRALMTKITHKLDLSALSRVDTILVENAWMRDFVREHAPSTDVVFAPPGVDTTVFTPSDKPFSDRNYILSVGRFADPRKNVPLLFRTYARLHDQMEGLPPELVLAGRTGPTPADWELAEELRIREHVRFHEDIDLETLADLYRNAKVFVLTSDEEGLGLVILEAMASGLPVVSTNCGGPSTVVQDGKTGYLTPVGDAGALSDALMEMLASMERVTKMGKEGYRRAIEEFSREATAKAFLQVYDQLLSRTEASTYKQVQ